MSVWNYQHAASLTGNFRYNVLKCTNQECITFRYYCWQNIGHTKLNVSFIWIRTKLNLLFKVVKMCIKYQISRVSRSIWLESIRQEKLTKGWCFVILHYMFSESKIEEIFIMLNYVRQINHYHPQTLAWDRLIIRIFVLINFEPENCSCPVCMTL